MTLAKNPRIGGGANVPIQCYGVENINTGGHSMTTYQRGVLALRMKDAIAAKAKGNMSLGGKGLENSLNPIHTDKTLAEAADISDNTIRKIEHVERYATESIKAAARAGKISTHDAYRLNLSNFLYTSPNAL